MEQGIKIVVGIMVALIIAFAVVYIFSERITGANEDIMIPVQEDSKDSIDVTLCKAIHGEDSFLITSVNQDGICDTGDCEKKDYLRGTTGGVCTDIPFAAAVPPDIPEVVEKCCCICKEF